MVGPESSLLREVHMIVSSELNMLVPHMIVSHGLNLIIHMVASPELNMISLCISSMMASSFFVSIIAHFSIVVGSWCCRDGHLIYGRRRVSQESQWDN